MRKILTRILLLAVILCIAFAVNRYHLLASTLQWIESMGRAGPILFIIIYILTAIFFVPSVVFTFAAGVLFGLPWAIVYALIGTGLGATGALLIGRYFARDWVAKAFARNEKLGAIDHAVRKRGWKIVALARLSPIFPFLVGNYAFGLTRISAFAYWAASTVGTLPSTTVYAYMGSLTGDLASLDLAGRERSGVEWLLFGVGFVATIILTWYVRKIAQVALEKNLDTDA